MSERHALGLESGTVLVVPHDERWPALFRDAARELRQALDGRILAIHHVGSTAVAGLAAKPILDLLAGVPDLDAALALVPALARLGYEFRPDEEIPDRHYFRRRRGTARTHHLSLAEPGSRHYRATLVFRDALRREPGLAAEYAALKLELARRHPADRPAYIDGKSAFVRGVLRAAGIE